MPQFTESVVEEAALAWLPNLISGELRVNDTERRIENVQ